ncbi:MAG: CsbD family protein [Allosphingosinicella sp.]
MGSRRATLVTWIECYVAWLPWDDGTQNPPDRTSASEKLDGVAGRPEWPQSGQRSGAELEATTWGKEALQSADHSIQCTATMFQNHSRFRSLSQYPYNQEEDVMKNRDNEPAIDSDRTEGSLKKMGGNLKEAAGTVLGDEKLKREGQADQTEGKLQNAWGGLKDKAREITGSNDRS